MESNDDICSSIKRICFLWLYYSVVFLCFELILRFATEKESVEISFYLFSSVFTYSFLTALLISILDKQLIYVASALITLFTGLFYAVQICFYGVFSTYATLSVILEGTGALTNFPQIVTGTVKSNSIYLLLLLVLILLSTIFPKTIQNCRLQKNKSVFFLLSSLFIAVQLSFLLTFFPFKTDVPNSPVSIYTEKHPVATTVSIIGGRNSLTLESKRMLFGNDFISAIVLRKIAAFFAIDNTIVDGTEDMLPVNTKEKTASAETMPDTVSEKKAQILPIDFKKLLNDDCDEQIHDMDRYFSSLKPDYENEYTGIFKGKNLIFITAESFWSAVVREDITPVLYKMMNEGFKFTNFYTPYWEVSTTDGEYVNCLSLLPKSGTYSFRDSAKNFLPFTLGNQFRRLGYTTKAYHNYLGSYYDRNISHPNMGYDFSSMGDGYRTIESWPDSDHEMMKITLPEYIDEPKFHAYYMTISGHLPYDFWANAIAIKHREEVEHLDYDEAIKAYFACTIDLDNALGYILEELEKRGIAEDTVIVLAADHYPYGLTIEQMRLLAGKHFDSTFGLYENNMIIYNPGQKPVEVSKICSNLDILPTLSNLFGLPYDSRLFIGHDVFSDADPFVVFKCINVVTDKLKYRGDRDFAVPQDNAEITKEDISTVKKQLAQKIKYSELILERDYYRRIWENITESKTE